jgi:hypothetical protein
MPANELLLESRVRSGNTMDSVPFGRMSINGPTLREGTISHDTCGTNSVRLMIADAVTGRVDDVFCIFWDYDYSMPERGLPTGVEYHPDSSLLIAHGCWDAEKPECGDHYFKMTPHGLVQIRWIPFNQRTSGMYADTAAR